MTVRNYVNGAPLLTLATAVSAGDLTLEVDSTAGFPAVPFTIALERATVNEEVCLCTGKDSTTFTVTRGWDGTTAKSHGIGAAIEHTTAAIEYREANEHINSTGDVHPQYLLKSAYTAKGRVIVGTGAGTFAALAVGSNDAVLIADSAEASGVRWGALSAAALGSGAVTTVKIADLNVTTAKLADGSVTEPKLGNASVITAKVADQAITTGKLGNASVTQAKVADNAIGTAQIINLNVTTVKLADASVTEAKLADGAVATAKLANSSVTADKLGTGSVVNAKLGALAVTGGKIAASTISEDKLAGAVLAAGWTPVALDAGWANSSFGNQPLSYKRVGNVGYLVGTVNRTGDGGNGLKIGTIPPGHRPPAETWGATFRGHTGPGWSSIASDGDIYCNADNGAEVSINMNFPVVV